MTEFLELEEYSQVAVLANKIYVNKSHVSFLKPTGLYTLVILLCGKELKVRNCVSNILEQYL